MFSNSFEIFAKQNKNNVATDSSSEIANFKTNFYQFCDDNKINNLMKYTIIHNDKTEDIIDTYINRYICNLTQHQVNNILCEYGIAKAIALFHDFHVIGMNCSKSHVCDYFEDPSLKTDYHMIELIFLDVVEFQQHTRTRSQRLGGCCL